MLTTASFQPASISAVHFVLEVKKNIGVENLSWF